ncbi:MAG: anhydro-N-acetylmuramic acid kinase [Cyanobacteria bacterium P01_C01_bin.89]
MQKAQAGDQERSPKAMKVVGLISGTSVDGIDAAFVEIKGGSIDLSVKAIAGHTFPYPPELRDRILGVCAGEALSFQDAAALDDGIATEFAKAALSIQGKHSADLIGSHGQTVFHRPPQLADRLNQDWFNGELPLGYSNQLGRGGAIAYLTQIPTVDNFRVADIALGGQGAPLVPRVDAYLLGQDRVNRCVQNIGGMGNVTYLPRRQGYSNLEDWENAIAGWDTGPGNVLIDLAMQHFTEDRQTYDANGSFARSGVPCVDLVELWLSDPFFRMPPPKSTGRELFGRDYLGQCLADANQFDLQPADIVATLTDFTAASIVQNYRDFLPKMPDQVLLCGGGSKNAFLCDRLQRRLGSIQVTNTDAAHLSSDYKEAIAFAILAYWHWHDIPGNLPSVTGSTHAIPLGQRWIPNPAPKVSPLASVPPIADAG